jgi:DNA-binding NarL/FixJ family response regulator
VTSAPLKILLVEDSGVLVERLRELFDQVQGVDVVGAVDSEQEAITSLEEQPVDVVVLDLQLKRGTGFGVLRHLSASGERPAVIVLTNYDLPEYRREATALGAQYFLDKARDYDRLVEVLGELRDRAA